VAWLKLKKAPEIPAAEVAGPAEAAPKAPPCSCGRDRAALADLAARAEALARLVRAEWHAAGVDASLPATLLLARVAEECEGLASGAATLCSGKS
jgi:hypothetical protein